MAVYRDIATDAPDYQPMEFYSSADEEPDLAEWLAGPIRSGGRQRRPGRGRIGDQPDAKVIDLPTGSDAS